MAGYTNQVRARCLEAITEAQGHDAAGFTSSGELDMKYETSSCYYQKSWDFDNVGKDPFIKQMKECVAICDDEDDRDGGKYGVNWSRGTIVCCGNGFDFKYGNKDEAVKK
jgi:hypothetical protein